jgi:hypothetical protein
VSLRDLIAKNGPVTVAAAVPAVSAVPPTDEPPITARTATTATAKPESQKSELAGVTFAEPVRCADCQHFEPGPNPPRGGCGAGVTLAAPLPWHQRGERLAAGFGDPELWATDPRDCESWLPRGLAEAVNAMADRWGYSADEREWALEQATQHPQEWSRMIEADLQGRRWPGGEGWP